MPFDDGDVPPGALGVERLEVEDVGRDDRRALGGQGASLRRALAAGRAGDDDDLAGAATHAQTGGATKTPLSGSLNESRAMISDIGSAVPHWSWVIGSAMS